MGPGHDRARQARSLLRALHRPGRQWLDPSDTAVLETAAAFRLPPARQSQRHPGMDTMPRCHAVSWTESLGPQATIAIVRTCKIRRLTCGSVEPPIGIEPMTYALRGACALPAYALAAPIAPAIALAALTALGLSDDPVHEPVHARAPAPVILLLCVIPPRTLYPRTRAGPARHELTVFRIAVKYSSRAMSGAGVRRSQSPRVRGATSCLAARARD